MSSSRLVEQTFAHTGVAIVKVVVDPITVRQATEAIAEGHAQGPRRAGSRRWLDQPWCRDLALQLQRHPQLATLVPHHVPVQCTAFDKHLGRNWLVPWHQDIHVPMPARIDDARLTGWSLKEGTWHAAAPREWLQQWVALRLHLDDCGADQGPLRVLPGSHALGILDDTRIHALAACTPSQTCLAPSGAVVAMRPLLVHASSKAQAPAPRRVLHFLYAPIGLKPNLWL